MDTFVVEAVKLNTLPVSKSEAIRAAEAEAEAFYQNVEDEEAERFRLAELKHVCGLMWNNRNSAVKVATAKLSESKLFSEAEKATILTVAENLHYDAPIRATIKAHDFINATARLYRTMKSGYYFENFPATELLARHA